MATYYDEKAMPHDPEKAIHSRTQANDADYKEPKGVFGDAYAPQVVDGAAVGEEDIERKGTLFRWSQRLFSMGVEARGIERVPEDERSNKHVLNVLLMWFSVNVAISTVPVGMLALPYYTMQFKHTMAAIITFNIIGCACVGFVATLGPKTGLRTMVISRYSSGYVGGAIFSILNILTQLGFSVTSIILGAQLLNQISGKLPLVVAVIIIAVIIVSICFFGYDYLHYYEKYAYIVIAIIYCMMYGLGGHLGYNVSAGADTEDTGLPFAGDFLTFGAIIFSSAAGWAPVAADFNCRLPADISSVKVFLMTFFGLFIPLIFVETLGAIIITIDGFEDLYLSDDAGAVIAELFSSWNGGGKFLLVILAFSVIANNIPNTYSAALSIQALHPALEKVPRAIWTLLVALTYTLAAVFGRQHFSAVLSNFLAVLGYWIGFFIAILASEHFIFRKFMLPGYDLTAYTSLRKLPPGFAGIFAMCCGVAGLVPGMAETWYIGPIAQKFGEYGGDVGFELAAAFAFVGFLPARYLEIRYFGR